MYGRLLHVSLSSSYFDPDDFTTSAWEKEEEEREEKHKAGNWGRNQSASLIVGFQLGAEASWERRRFTAKSSPEL